MRKKTLFLLLLLCHVTAVAQSTAQAERWTQQRANEWHKKQSWLVGCNYNPANAINELVLFDSVWDPNPQLGKQRAPKPGVHNSGWMQSPGAKALQDAAQYPRLEAYVKGVVGAFAKDKRILAWDIWNEPDNLNGNSYGALEPKNKGASSPSDRSNRPACR